ncbi:ABC-F family ATP-binding cassette domain-containing protein [Lachnospiraceae bacterium MD1]|uniref:ABC-F family ATP-binding cassette domain-containing protein n=1 Tax=Variimorphobacter saccharofermentans TaxID=2755051 RepID=A0A839JYW1_9FIRM|nr:ABC-F family ATP-binding cassette domain-containing protein [Variimorphobacter saccharofermentans]MBB2182600.1 ABC-F family ATP-binding cassette domain-containing protein [Variimorphobacter saccharofermentans]
MILACQNISKSFGTTEILKNVSFHVNEKEKVAIVGINGAGKSTLLKIIMKELSADEGEVILAKGSTIGYLAQHQNLTSENSILDEMLTVKQDVIDLDANIRKLEQDMKHAEGAELNQMLSTYTRLMHEFEIKNGYAYQSEVTGILKGLGFMEEEFDKKVNTLSGGQKTRIALGKLLLSKPDIILLDEPTNHLDLISIAWLETFLLNYNGAVIVVAHDRYFLDKVVSKVVELDNMKCQSFEGNYSVYAQKKEMLRNAMLKQYLNQQQEIKHQEEVIAKLRSFNREKSIKRAESREKMLEKIERIERPTDHSEMHFHLEPRIISGNDVLKVTDLAKSYGNLTLFTNLNFEIKRGEKVAIIGNNGTGKTTILKIINGQVKADQGEIKLGSKVHVGYYDQEHQVLDPDKTLFDELQDTYPNLDNTTIRNILAAFLFTEDDVFKRIKDISGGERGRVSLAKLMLSEANLLILDEPTNHLDITSKEILENAINQYQGTVLYVSHDRYFINKTATRILDLTEQTLLNYIGNYDYYLEKKPEVEAAYLGRSTISQQALYGTKPGAFPASLSSRSATTTKENDSDNKQTWQQQKEEQAKIRKRKNDLKKTEEEIHQLELRSEEIDALLTKEEIYTNVSKLLELNNEKKELEIRLEELLEQWESLASEE